VSHSGETLRQIEEISGNCHVSNSVLNGRSGVWEKVAGLAEISIALRLALVGSTEVNNPPGQGGLSGAS
jgi:hypothetical protein